MQGDDAGGERFLILVSSCQITRDEVILAKLKFLRRRPDGQLTREEFLAEAKVKEDIHIVEVVSSRDYFLSRRNNDNMLKYFCPGSVDGPGSVQGV